MNSEEVRLSASGRLLPMIVGLFSLILQGAKPISYSCDSLSQLYRKLQLACVH